MEPKTTQMLPPSLQDLHKDSRSWISELKFWIDEIDFFMNLLDRYFLKAQTSGDMSHMAKLYDEIMELKTDHVKPMLDQTIAHEKYLADLEQKLPGRADQKFRDDHTAMESRIRHLHADYKSLKRELYGYIEELM